MIHEDITISGSFQASGSFILPRIPSNSLATATTGSMFYDTVNDVVKIYTGTGSTSDGYVTVGAQSEPPTLSTGADIEYLVVAGGGGAGFDLTAGGGAGGLLSSSLSSIESGSSITVTVGAGGAGYTTGGVTSTADGTASSIASAAGTSFTTVSTVGGGGGSRVATTPGRDGGSGGGCGRGNQGNTNPGSGTTGQGNDGGADTDSPAGTGGGGAGAVGGTASGTGNPSNGGNGGDGLASSITGTSTYYAGGGGGGGYYGSAGTGGSGGGGNGSGGNAQNNQESGDANTGGGGGGGGQNSTAAASGGSGIVVLAYPTASISATGGLRTFFNDRVAHIFNSSGTLTVGGTKTYTHDTLDVFGDSSCLALYKLDGNANDAGGNYNGTASNVTYVQSVINQGGDFNGSSSYISRNNGFLPTGNASRSFSFWTNLDTHSSDAYFMSYGNGVTGQFFSPRVTPTSQGGYISFMGYAADLNSSVVMTTGEWMHLCYTYDGTTLKIYKNATEIGSGNLSLNTATTRDFTIGARDYDGTITKHIDGKLDQIRIFNKALSASEVATLYTE